MRLIKYALLLMITGFMNGQSTWEAGLSFGGSELLRDDTPNYYNYSNVEYGGFLKYERNWNHTPRTRWVKYWSLEGNVQFSDYEHLYSHDTSTVYRMSILGGISVQLPIESLDLRIGGFFGPAYHTGYKERLTKGLVFSEGIYIRAATNVEHKFIPSLSVGYMHTSNGNIYELNKGLETLYMKIGWQLK